MKLRHKRRRKLVEAWLDTELIPPLLYIRVGDEPFPLGPLIATGNYDLVKATDAELQGLEDGGYLLDRAEQKVPPNRSSLPR